MGELKKANLGLPIRPFLYTLDQIAGLLVIDLRVLKRDYLYYDGLSTDFQQSKMLLARNIAPAGVSPEWRVSEQELVRWLKRNGFRVYERAWVQK